MSYTCCFARFAFVPREKLIKLYLSQKHYYRRASLPENRFKRLTPIVSQLIRRLLQVQQQGLVVTRDRRFVGIENWK